MLVLSALRIFLFCLLCLSDWNTSPSDWKASSFGEKSSTFMFENYAFLDLRQLSKTVLATAIDIVAYWQKR